MEAYQQLLTYIKSAVTRNYSEKSINSILDHISTAVDMDFMENFYSTTLHALEESQNEVMIGAQKTTDKEWKKKRIKKEQKEKKMKERKKRTKNWKKKCEKRDKKREHIQQINK